MARAGTAARRCQHEGKEPAKPGKKGWVHGSKLAFFKAHKHDFLAAVETKGTSAFYSRVAGLYLNKYGYHTGWDEDLDEGQEVADDVDPEEDIDGLTAEEIGVWYHAQYGGGQKRLQKTKTFKQLFDQKAVEPLKPTKPHILHFYSGLFYHERIKARLNTRWAEICRLKLAKPPALVNMRNLVTKEAWESETPEFQRGVLASLAKQHGTAQEVHKIALAKDMPLSAEEYSMQRYLAEAQCQERAWTDGATEDADPAAAATKQDDSPESAEESEDESEDEDDHGVEDEARITREEVSLAAQGQGHQLALLVQDIGGDVHAATTPPNAPPLTPLPALALPLFPTVPPFPHALRLSMPLAPPPNPAASGLTEDVSVPLSPFGSFPPVISVSRGREGRRGDRFRMGYDRARECRRSTEVNGRGFRNTDMDHYTTARFKGMKEGKEDGRGLPEVKAGMPEEKCRRLEEVRLDVRDKIFDKSGRRTEDGSQVRWPEYSDVEGSVKTTENDGKPNNVNNQSKTFYSNSGDRNIKPEEDGDEQMITGSHPVVARMSSGDEPEVNRRRPGVDREWTGRWPEVIGITRMIGKSDGEEEEWQRKLLKAEVELPHWRREFKPEDERHPGSGGLSRKRLTCAGVRVGDPANTEGMNEGGRKSEVQRKSRKKAKVEVWKRKWMKKFRNPNAGGCEMDPTSFGDSPKVTITDERTSPIARPEVVGEIVAELFHSRNLLHVCPTVKPERTEVTERSFGGRNFRVGIRHKRKP
ncbi:hypothetical protein K438DRAFT_1747122 [Mycena galopus ATCC 62051]|nr:hypothetical protein K438DRAFT_1747122 [Mycena galopus ATCC 62051]